MLRKKIKHILFPYRNFMRNQDMYNNKHNDLFFYQMRCWRDDRIGTLQRTWPAHKE